MSYLIMTDSGSSQDGMRYQMREMMRRDSRRYDGGYRHHDGGGRSYEDGYREGYRHGYDDAADDSDNDGYRRERDNRGRYM